MDDSLVRFVSTGSAGRSEYSLEAVFEIENGAIFGLLEDTKGRVWVGTGAGVVRIEAGDVRKL